MSWLRHWIQIFSSLFHSRLHLTWDSDFTKNRLQGNHKPHLARSEVRRTKHKCGTFDHKIASIYSRLGLIRDCTPVAEMKGCSRRVKNSARPNWWPFTSTEMSGRWKSYSVAFHFLIVNCFCSYSILLMYTYSIEASASLMTEYICSNAQGLRFESWVGQCYYNIQNM